MDEVDIKSEGIKGYQFDRTFDSVFNISDNLSELTNFVSEVLIDNLKKNKSITLAYPSTHLNMVGLFSYLYSKIFEKDVIVVSTHNKVKVEGEMYSSLKRQTKTKSVSLIKKHIVDYELLSNKMGDYLYLYTIPIEKTGEQNIIKIYTRRSRKRIRDDDVEYLFEMSTNAFTKKLIFTDYEDIISSMQNKQHVFFEDLNKDQNLNVKIGLIIFENLNLHLTSQEMIKNFISWIKKFPEEIKFVFHFSDTYSIFPDILKSQLGTEYINLNHYLIREYQSENQDAKKERTPAIERYDIHSKKISEPEYEIIDPVDPGNQDELNREIKSMIWNINKNLKSISYNFAPLSYLKRSLRYMLIHPSMYKVIIRESSSGGYRMITIDEYLEFIRDNELSKLEGKDQSIIDSLITTLKTLYIELRNTKRIGEVGGFEDRDCKNSKLMDYLLELDDGKRKKIVIATYNKSERRILNEQIDSLKLKNISYNIITYRKALYSTQDSEKEIILPGVPLSTRHLTIFLNNYKHVNFLIYGGEEEEILNNQLLEYENPDYLQQSYDTVKEYVEKKKIKARIVSPDKIKNKIKAIQAKKKLVTEETEEELKVEEPQTVYPTETEKPKETIIDFERIKSFEDSVNDVNFANRQWSEIEASDCNLVLRSEKTNNIINYGCTNNSRFVKIQNDESQETLTFDELERGDRIMIFPDRKGIFDLVADIYGLKEDIEMEYLESYYDAVRKGLDDYREKLAEDQGIFHKRATISDLHYEYVQRCKRIGITPKTFVTFLTWYNGLGINRIGPDSDKDILILGAMGKFPSISSELKRITDNMDKLRVLHIRIGRKLPKIIRLILNKMQADDSLNPDEQMLHDKLDLFTIMDKIEPEDTDETKN